MNDRLKERKKVDRRQTDQGTPTGWKERRRSAERRLLEVGEASFEEWVSWMARQRTRRRSGEGPTVADDPNKPPHNRRSGKDRRQEELGSPSGWHDRRQGERRRSQVAAVTPVQALKKPDNT